MLDNHGFEAAGSTVDKAEYWEWDNPDRHGGTWGNVVRDDTRARTGNWQGTIRNTGVGTNYGGWWQEKACTAGVAYVFSSWFYADTDWTNQDSQGITIEFWSGDDYGTNFLSDTVYPFDGVGKAWVKKVVYATAPTNADWVRAVVWANNLGATGNLQFDDLDLDVDSDEDGLPDSWEEQYGLNPFSGIGGGLNLLAHWTFDETNGTAVADASGHGHTGLVSGAISATNWREGKIDGSLYLDGVNDYVAIAQPVAIVTQSPFSVSAWVYLDGDVPDTSPTILSDAGGNGIFGPAGTNYGFWLNHWSADRCLRFWFGGVSSYTAIANSLDDGLLYTDRWVHVTATHDGDIGRLYLNGNLVRHSWGCPVDFAQNSSLRIGRGFFNAGAAYWKGRIDDVRLYGSLLESKDIADLYDAQADLDGDLETNLDEYRNGSDPTSNLIGRFPTEGALDISFVPVWATNSGQRYIAQVGSDSMAGNDLHLRVTSADDLEYIIWDSLGRKHQIRHQDVIKNGHIVTGMTNRIVAAWRNFGSKQTNAEMRLFVNGLDYRAAFCPSLNPKYTRWNWTWPVPTDYSEAVGVECSLLYPVDGSTVNADGTYTNRFPVSAEIVDFTIHTQAYGMVSESMHPQFEPAGVKTNVPEFFRPQTIAQAMSQDPLESLNTSNAVSVSEAETYIKQFAEVFDGVEVYHSNWMHPSRTNFWQVHEQNLQVLIDVGGRLGLDMALSSWGHLDEKILAEHPALMDDPCKLLSIDSTGCVTCIDGDFIDMGDRHAISNYTEAWRMEMVQYTNYSYYFFNEGAGHPHDQSYTKSRFYSTDGLAWFREYVTNNYNDPKYEDVRFPISPIDYQMWLDNDIPPAPGLLTLDNSVTNLLEITTDPDLFAKWWEWRYVLWAHIFNGYCETLHDLNTNNPHWRGVIYFISPSIPWTPVSAVDMQLIAQVPGLEWMIMENTRLGSYGSDDEAEVQLQLSDLRRILTNGTGFGCYAQVLRYQDQPATGGFSYRIDYMTSDMAYAVSPVFDCDIVVPYNAALLVNRDGYVGNQGSHYIQEAADAWQTVRYRDMWGSIGDLGPCDEILGRSNDLFSWSMPDQFAWFNLEFSSNSTFAPIDISFSPATNQFVLGDSGVALDLETNIFWRVRGQYDVLDIENDGSVSSTDFYDGVWAACGSGFVIADSDADGLPDYWEEEYLGTLAWGATNDVDGDRLSNWGEYRANSNPSNAYSVFDASYVLRSQESFVFTWPSAPGRTYAVYRSTNLAAGFSTLESDIPACTPENVYTASVSESERGFYSIKIQP
jgi:hypothetical protein